MPRGMAVRAACSAGQTDTDDGLGRPSRVGSAWGGRVGSIGVDSSGGVQRLTPAVVLRDKWGRGQLDHISPRRRARGELQLLLYGTCTTITRRRAAGPAPLRLKALNCSSLLGRGPIPPVQSCPSSHPSRGSRSRPSPPSPPPPSPYTLSFPFHS